MGVRLTFNKTFELSGAAGMNKASLDVITTDGEPVLGVRSVSVKQELGAYPIMTIEIVVTETFADNTAARLRK